jgi:DNA modification methylase
MLGMVRTGRPRLGLRVMTPTERQRRRRALLAREATTLPLNQVLVGHAAEVMAGWPSKSVDLIITSPPYFDAVAYDLGRCAGTRTRAATSTDTPAAGCTSNCSKRLFPFREVPRNRQKFRWNSENRPVRPRRDA